MRVCLLVVFLLLIVIVVGVCIYKFKLKMYGILGVVIVSMLIWVYGSNLICVNTLDSKTQEKVDEIISVCGDSTIKRSGARVLLRVNKDWVDVNEIEVSSPMYIKVNGVEVYVGNNGLVEAIRLLEKAGLIK